MQKNLLNHDNIKVLNLYDTNKDLFKTDTYFGVQGSFWDILGMEKYLKWLLGLYKVKFFLYLKT